VCRLVLVGGGIGITPMMSMLRWCLARQPQRDGAPVLRPAQQREHAFKAQLEELAARSPGAAS
jgi:ferredoxin-NADP reductase